MSSTAGLPGRMLAVPRVQKPHVKAWLDRFSKSPLFPWQGKTFKHETADHSHDGNAPVVRKVKDEVREVAPRVWLGLAYLTMRDGEHLACFFGIAKS